MEQLHVECLGCHQSNPAGTVFCTYCRRKLRVGGPATPAVAVAEKPEPVKRSWWQKFLG